MAIKATGQITLVDLSDSRQLSCYIACNVPKVQIYDPDANTYQPNWTNTNVILTPSLFLNQTGLPLTSSGLTIEWKRKEGTGSEAALTAGETVSNGKLTIKQNKLSSVTSGLLTYICYVTYLDPETDNTINISADLSFSLIKNASAAKTCDITGEQVFKYASSSSAASPAQITLTGTVAGCSITGWKYKKSDGTWADYPTTSDNANITGSTLVVKPNHTIFNGNVATIKLCTNDNDAYDIFSVSKLYDGVSGKSSVTAILTNDSCIIPFDETGKYAIYVDAVTEMIVYVGTVVDTGWTITASPSAGIQGNVSGQTYTITSFTKNSGYVDLTASKSGYPSITKRFTVSRQKVTTAPMIYSLSLDTPVVKRDKSDDYVPNTVVASSGYKVQYPEGTNFVFNGDFASTDISKWTARGGVALSFVEVDSKRALKANFMTEGKSSTDDFHTTFTRNLGYNDFVVSFSAKASAAMDLNLRGYKAESTEVSIETASLTTSWTDYTFTIKSTGTSNNVLVFWASAVGTVYLANVKVTAINNVIHCGYSARYSIYYSSDGENFTLQKTTTGSSVTYPVNLYTLGYLVENETNLIPNPSFYNSNGWNMCNGKASIDDTTKFRNRNSVKIVGAGTPTNERLSMNSNWPAYTTGKQLTLTVWLMSPDISKIKSSVDVYISYRTADNTLNKNDFVKVAPSEFVKAGNNNWFKVTIDSRSNDITNTKCTITIAPNNAEATLHVANPNLVYTGTANRLKAVRVDILPNSELLSNVLDSQTLVIVDDGADGDGGISVIVGDENRTISCTADGKVPADMTITIPYSAYKGISRVAANCTVGAMPNGMTLSSNTNATSNSDGQIVLAISKDSTLGGGIGGSVELTFTCEGQQIVKKFTWSKAKTGATGASAVTFTVYAPNGIAVQDQIGSLPLISQGYKGSTEITTGATYKWEKLESNNWVSKGTTKEITVQASDIVNIATYRCTMTYEKQTYVDVVTLIDKTDTIYPSVISTAGTVFKNSLGSTHLICKVFNPRGEVDKLLTENIGETAPTDPTTGTLWYKTWAPDKIVVLKKWNGTAWVNATEKQEYTYKWYRTDKDGNPYANESIFKTGKVIYVDDEDVNSKTIFTVEVE